VEEVKDPATGRSRAERALGESYPKKATAKKGVKTKKAPSSKAQQNPKDTRRNSNGMFDGPRPSYGRYNVSEQAQDILNRSLNRRTR
jgi:hypothetical protein